MESSILVDKVRSLSIVRSPNQSRDGTTSSSAYFSTAQSFAAINTQKPETAPKSPPSPEESLYSATLYSEAKQSFTNTEDPSESLRRESSEESDVSDETSSSNGGGAHASKPHKGNDARWDAIQAVRSRHGGAIGLSNFKLVRKLGSGDIGSVYLAELSGTRAAFAMKVMDKATLASRKKLPRVHTEREILQALDHPFLPTLYTHFETENFSCLVIDFCPGGDLHALRQRQPGKYFSEHAARFYVAEVLLAMEYLHMLGIIYRDLKPENVLVREDGHIMLSDFDLSLRCTFSPSLSHGPDAGPAAPLSCMVPRDCVGPAACFGPRFFSKKSQSQSQSRHVRRKAGPAPELVAEPTGARSMSFVGTHEYLAPEIVRGEGHGSAVDWWTFGVFLYELLFGRTPFKGAGNRATLFNVVGQPLRFPEAPSVSFAARDLIRGLLVKEPQHRLAYRRGAAEIKQHPFFQSVNWALVRCASPPEIPKPVVASPEIPNPASANGNGKSSSRDGEVRTSGNYVEIDFF